MADPEGSLFVDGGNWSHALSDLNALIDFHRLVYAIQNVTRVKITKLYYYTAYRSQSDLNRRLPFLEKLGREGWEIFAMPSTLGMDDVWRDKEIDISIALDAYEEVRSGFIQSLILGTGDGDFAALFRRLPAEIGKWSIGFRNHMSPALRGVSTVLYIESLGVLYPRGR